MIWGKGYIRWMDDIMVDENDDDARAVIVICYFLVSWFMVHGSWFMGVLICDW